MSFITTPAPVSYTHLDVYKRQGYDFVAQTLKTFFHIFKVFRASLYGKISVRQASVRAFLVAHRCV